MIMIVRKRDGEAEVIGMVNCVPVVHSEMLAEPQASPKHLH